MVATREHCGAEAQRATRRPGRARRHPHRHRPQRDVLCAHRGAGPARADRAIGRGQHGDARFRGAARHRLLDGDLAGRRHRRRLRRAARLPAARSADRRHPAVCREAGDARAFMSALRAAARTKPVVVLKAGRSLEPDAFARHRTRSSTPRSLARERCACRPTRSSSPPRESSRWSTSRRAIGWRSCRTVADRRCSRRIARIAAGVRLAQLGPDTVGGARCDSASRSRARQSGRRARRRDARALRRGGRRDAQGRRRRCRAGAARGAAGRSVPPMRRAPWRRSRATSESRCSVRGSARSTAAKSTRRSRRAASPISSRRRTRSKRCRSSPPIAATRRGCSKCRRRSRSPSRPISIAPNACAQRRSATAHGILSFVDACELLAAFGIAAAPFAVADTLVEAESAARRLRFPVSLAFDAVERHGPQRRGIRTRKALAHAWGEFHMEPRPERACRTCGTRDRSPFER